MTVEMPPGELTTLVKARKDTPSLRTTVPMSVVKRWGLDQGSKLDWTWEVVNGKLVIIVTPYEEK